jgi:23S rRNA C2498 (ribose-2'-O)-methylase RlmM
MNTNQFYYFICNIGSEAFLKAEIKAFYPQLRFAFSAAGFLTFKVMEALPVDFSPVFTRHFGEYIARGTLQEMEKLKTNEFEIIEVSETVSYLGRPLSRFKLHYPEYVLPDNAPSRAYLKILEAADRANVNFVAGERALEIGASPGGACFALLSKGLNVIGVDTGVMAQVCLDNPNFLHYQKSIQHFDPKYIMDKIDWLLVDMNLAPEATLHEIEKIIVIHGHNLKGVFLTLKMTKIGLVERLPFYKKLAKRMGIEVEFMTQLPSHKQEFLLFGKISPNI